MAVVFDDDTDLIATLAAPCTVPLFIDGEPAGTGVLVYWRGAQFILTALHVLQEEDGGLTPRQLSFGLPTDPVGGRVELPAGRIGRLPEYDAAIIDLNGFPRDLGAAEGVLADSALDLRCAVIASPADERIRRLTSYIVGYPEECAWSDDSGCLLAPTIYRSGAPTSGLWHKAFAESQGARHLSSIPKNSNRLMSTGEHVPEPNLRGSSGGPWFVVEQTTDGAPRARLLAIHSKRASFRFRRSNHTVAFGVPMSAYFFLLERYPRFVSAAAG